MRLQSLAIISVILFVSGAYIWKISNRGAIYESNFGLSDEEFYIKVGKKNISKEEVDLIYKQHVSVIKESDELTAIPAVADVDATLSRLKLDITGNFLEREVLLRFIEMDKTYAIDTKKFYQECASEAQERFSDLESTVLGGEEHKDIIIKYCDRSYILNYFEDRVVTKIEVSELELEAYYHNNKKEFKTPAKVKIRQIVLADENTAKKVRYRTRNYNFEKMVKEYSIAPEKETGGVIGPYKQGDMPRFFDVAFQMRKGQISGVLKSIYGFHIIQVLKKYKKSTLTFVAAKPMIKKKILAKKKQEVYREWVEEALKTVNVTISKY